MKSILLSIIYFLITGSLIYAQNYNCDDFTTAPFDISTTFNQGDTISGVAHGNQIMTTTAVVLQNQYQNSPGFYMVDGSIITEFNGLSQSAVFELYGEYVLSDVDKFSVNGSQQIPMDTLFPLTVNSVYVDMDTSAPNIGFVESVYLSLSGNLATFEFFGFESGIKKMCTTEEILLEDCISLASPIYGNSQYYFDGDTIASNQGGIELMVAVDAVSANYSGTSPGLYFIDAGVDIDLAPGIQYFSSIIYGFYSQFNQMSIEVNNSQVPIYLDATFPQNLGNGVVIDLDTTVQDFGNWEVASLTVTGNLSAVNITGFESGILNACAFVVPVNVGLVEFNQEEVELFPNPSNGQVNINFSHEIVEVNIFDTKGEIQRINIKEIEDGFVLDCANLPPGVYIVELVNPIGKTIHKRFVKY